MIDENEIQKQWLERVHAIGRTQNRHLWSTLVAALFFPSVYLSLGKQTVTVPIIESKLPAQFVLATGSFILALLIIATLGSIRAWRDAVENYAGNDWPTATDRLDLNPNVLDLVLYTTRGGRPLLIKKFLDKAIILLGYPGYITVVFVESLLLFWWLWSSDAPGRSVLLSAAALLLPFAFVLIIQFWCQRFKQVFTKPPKEGQMPNIVFEGPCLTHNQKAELVREFTAVASRVIHLPPSVFVVIIKENLPENVGVGGELLSDRTGPNTDR